MTTQPPLLATADPPAYRLCNPEGCAPWVITADHAGRAIPHALGSLGLRAADLDRHIAWDIGIAGLAEQLAERLDAFKHWYSQAGTPRVTARGRWDAPSRSYTLGLEQHCAPSPGQAVKEPFVIPIAMGLVAVSYTHLTLPTSDLV